MPTCRNGAVGIPWYWNGHDAKCAFFDKRHMWMIRSNSTSARFNSRGGLHRVLSYGHARAANTLKQGILVKAGFGEPNRGYFIGIS